MQNIILRFFWCCLLSLFFCTQKIQAQCNGWADASQVVNGTYTSSNGVSVSCITSSCNTTTNGLGVGVSGGDCWINFAFSSSVNTPAGMVDEDYHRPSTSGTLVNPISFSFDPPVSEAYIWSPLMEVHDGQSPESFDVITNATNTTVAVEYGCIRVDNGNRVVADLPVGPGNVSYASGLLE